MRLYVVGGVGGAVVSDKPCGFGERSSQLPDITDSSSDTYYVLLMFRCLVHPAVLEASRWVHRREFLSNELHTTDEWTVRW